MQYSVYSQSVAFTYDQAGNRTARTIVTPPLKSTDEFSEAPVEYSLDQDYKLIVFPNPTSGILNMELIGWSKSTLPLFDVRIYSTTGSLIVNQSFNVESFNLDITNQPPGIYVLELVYEGKKELFSIIKE